MSRSGYNEGDVGGEWALICWRGAVASSIHGKRGQRFLFELVKALDALPAPRLIANSFEDDGGEFCALGSVGRARGLDMAELRSDDEVDRDAVADAFGIPEALAAEIMYLNDEAGRRLWFRDVPEETPEQRFDRIRAWALGELRPETLLDLGGES